MSKATEASIKKRISEKRQDHQKENSKYQQKYTAAIKRACSSPDGKILLHYLMQETGYQKNSVQGSTVSGEFMDNNTMYNEGRRDLYLNLRRILDKETLASVEVYGALDGIKDDTYDDMFK